MHVSAKDKNPWEVFNHYLPQWLEVNNQLSTNKPRHSIIALIC